MRHLIISIAILMVLVSVQAQSNDDELTRLKESVRDKVSKQMKDWNYRSVQPIQGSTDVIIQQWQLNDIIVKVAITRSRTETDAQQSFKDFKDHLRVEEAARSRSRGKPVHLIKQDSFPDGDEGLVRDVRGSEAVSFRKGKFIVDISVPSPAINKDVFFSRQFAHHVLKPSRKSNSASGSGYYREPKESMEKVIE